MAEQHAKVQSEQTLYYQDALNHDQFDSHSDQYVQLQQEASLHSLTAWTPTEKETYQTTYQNFITHSNKLYGATIMDYVLPLQERPAMLSKKKPFSNEQAAQFTEKAMALKEIMTRNPSMTTAQAITHYTEKKTEEAWDRYHALKELPDPIAEAITSTGNGLRHAAPLFVRPLLGFTAGAIMGAVTGLAYGEWHAFFTPTSNGWEFTDLINESTLIASLRTAIIGAGIGTADTAFPSRHNMLPLLTNNLLTWPESSSLEEARSNVSASFYQAATALKRLQQIHTATLNIEKAAKEQERAKIFEDQHTYYSLTSHLPVTDER